MQGKVAIVTGAAGGIGEAIVRALGARGVKVLGTTTAAYGFARGVHVWRAQPEESDRGCCRQRSHGQERQLHAAGFVQPGAALIMGLLAGLVCYGGILLNNQHDIVDQAEQLLYGRERYDERQLIEVPMLVGHYHMVAFTLNSLGVQREPGVPGFDS